jgi:nucleotide-binding universal stress UspA family protein
VEGDEKMYQRILIPLERKGGPEGHIRHAAALASGVGAEITLLRVITVVPSEDPLFQRMQVEAGSRAAQRKAEAEAYVDQLADQLQEEGVNVRPVVVVSGKAEDEAIVEYAAELSSDLIVLPNQRRSLVSRWLQGNVTAKVQRRSDVPVLLVRDIEKGE